MDGIKLRQHHCKHCGGTITAGDEKCPHCGIPLAPGFSQAIQRKFIGWFIALVIFCLLIILWLPPDWTHIAK